MKMFTKHAQLIIGAARSGGADPALNTRLADKIRDARADNMAKELIDRALKRAADPGSANAEDLWYESVGPFGCAVIVHCLSDSKNRTAMQIRSVLARHGGSLQPRGHLSYAFAQRAQVVVDPHHPTESSRDVEEAALSSGAFDVLMEQVPRVVSSSPAGASSSTSTRDDGELTMVTAAVLIVDPPSLLSQVEHSMSSEFGFRVLSSGIVYRPTSYVTLDEERATQFTTLLEALDECDDVQHVYHNAELPPPSTS